LRIYLSRDLREANRSGAEGNRRLMKERRVLLVNVIGSPGSGKTALLQHTLKGLSGFVASVIEADLYTEEDARRLEPWCHGIAQINTEGACHLEAGMIGQIIQTDADILSSDILFIENIGNLICPAEFDLGEDLRVTVLSVGEGSDKPAKYPLAFKESQAVILSKVDLLPFCDFDMSRVTEDIRRINPEATVIPLSVTTGEGLKPWLQWLEEKARLKKGCACD